MGMPIDWAVLLSFSTYFLRSRCRAPHVTRVTKTKPFTSTLSCGEHAYSICCRRCTHLRFQWRGSVDEELPQAFGPDVFFYTILLSDTRSVAFSKTAHFLSGNKSKFEAYFLGFALLVTRSVNICVFIQLELGYVQSTMAFYG